MLLILYPALPEGTVPAGHTVGAGALQRAPATQGVCTGSTGAAASVGVAVVHIKPVELQVATRQWQITKTIIGTCSLGGVD